MEGMTKAQMDLAEAGDLAVNKRPLRPRDAATLILLDRSQATVRVLLGRRHSRHAFMPGKFVFPGGRTDPADSRISAKQPLNPKEEAKLIGSGSRASSTRARAIALSAIRETYEEAGILIGHKTMFSTTRADWKGFQDCGVAPSLESLRYIARAITPPGRVRRFDTRFLACFRDAVALELPEGGPTQELEDLIWLPISDAMEADIPSITKMVLTDLMQRLEVDPDLSPGGPVPFYRLRNGLFQRSLL